MFLTVSGIDEVCQALDALPKELAATAYLRALKAAGEVVAAALEEATPIKSEDTGGLLDRDVLRESVMLDVQLDSQSRGGSVDVGFGANGVVAYWLEYGHRAVGHKPDKRFLNKFVKAAPFVRRAADESAEAAIEAFFSVLQQNVGQVAAALKFDVA